MRIAFFSPHSDPLARPGEPDSGGQCVYEARLAEALAGMGYPVRDYTRLAAGKPVAEAIAPHADIRRFPMGPEGFLRKEEMGPHLAEFSRHVLADDRTWLAETDIFHGHYWDGGVAALEASLALGKPLVFTSHSLGMLKRDGLPDNSLYHYDVRIPAETRVMRAADAVIALSSIEKEALTDRYGIAAENIHIVPGGVEVQKRVPSMSKAEHKAKLGIESDLMVFAVGRLDARKGFLEWIDAMPAVARAVAAAGRSVCFMMPKGPKEPSEEETGLLRRLQQKARELEVEEHIHWFHRLSDDELYHAYCAADLFVCPSLYEPFGLVLVEAMAAGTPVVATCFGGPVDIVEPGRDGFLADPRDNNAWSDAVLKVLLASPAERQALNEAALAKARRYSWDAVATEIGRVYAQTLQAYRRFD